VPDSLISVINAGATNITMTAAAGGTNPVAATLIVQELAVG
jgi:hypothetical protein